MPELPDVTVYVEALERRIVGTRLEQVRLRSPFLLRTVRPTPAQISGRSVACVRRLGKRIVIGMDGDFFLVIHLMIAGRLHWKEWGATIPARAGLAAFDFRAPTDERDRAAPGGGYVAAPAAGSLLLTESGSKRRASLHVVAGEAGLAAFDRGGIEVQSSSLAGFRSALVRENHTLKRALTDPRLFSGIGNAYSDEILHRAGLSPLRLTRRLGVAEVARLHAAAGGVLEEWTGLLRRQAAGRFPEKVTAFRPEMAVHGRFGRPCPACGAPVQRIVYAENECHYCARCQTGGKVLADRALSRLLKDDWPDSLEDLEELRRPRS